MTSTTVDDYIAAAPAAVQGALQEIRRTVQGAVPGAVETVAYKMPAFRQQRVFFYYAAFKKHLGVYPPVSDDAALVRELAPYRGEKGNLSFPLDQPIPYELITRVAVALARQYSKL